MIGAGFVLVEITAFCGVLSRVACTIAWWFICFLPWFLSLHTQLPSCLIFCSTFVHCLTDFLCRNPHFSLFCLLQVFLGVTSWVCAIFLYKFCFLLWSGLFTCILLVKATWFVVFVKFFVDFVAPVSACFFWCKTVCCTNLYLLVLLFLCIFLRLCTLSLLILSHASPLQSLTAKNYAHCPLCSVFWQALS